MLMMMGCEKERERRLEKERTRRRNREIFRGERECTRNREEEESRRFFTSLKILLFEKWTKIVEQV